MNKKCIKIDFIIEKKNISSLDSAESSSLSKGIGKENIILLRSNYSRLKSVQKSISFYEQVSKNENKSDK